MESFHPSEEFCMKLVRFAEVQMKRDPRLCHEEEGDEREGGSLIWDVMETVTGNIFIQAESLKTSRGSCQRLHWMSSSLMFFLYGIQPHRVGYSHVGHKQVQHIYSVSR